MPATSLGSYGRMKKLRGMGRDGAGNLAYLIEGVSSDTIYMVPHMGTTVNVAGAVTADGPLRVTATL